MVGRYGEEYVRVPFLNSLCVACFPCLSSPCEGFPRAVLQVVTRGGHFYFEMLDSKQLSK